MQLIGEGQYRLQIYFPMPNSIHASCQGLLGLKTATSAEQHAPRPTLDSRAADESCYLGA